MNKETLKQLVELSKYANQQNNILDKSGTVSDVFDLIIEKIHTAILTNYASRHDRGWENGFNTICDYEDDIINIDELVYKLENLKSKNQEIPNWGELISNNSDKILKKWDEICLENQTRRNDGAIIIDENGEIHYLKDEKVVSFIFEDERWYLDVIKFWGNDKNIEKFSSRLYAENCIKNAIIKQLGNTINLKGFKTMREIAEEYDISIDTLRTRLTLESFNLKEEIDYKKLGERMPTLLTPEGVRKITKS
ncbi:MAG TPA: hypothetical protein VIK72_19505 [Clostridiaceae bacterium]